MNKLHKSILVAFGVAVAVATVLLNSIPTSAFEAAPTVVADAPAIEATPADDTRTTAPAPSAAEPAPPSTHGGGDAAPTPNETTNTEDGATVDAASSQILIYEADVLWTGRCWGFCFFDCPCTVLIFF